MKIRTAGREDTALILQFVRELADYERLAHEVVATEGDLQRALFGERPFAEALIAEDDDGAPLGFALYFHNFSTFAGKPGLYLEDLFVRPAARGRGAGRALLSRLARLALERGCARLEWSVLDWNEPALRFYAALGAVPMSQWTVQRLAGDALRQLAEAAAQTA